MTALPLRRIAPLAACTLLAISACSGESTPADHHGDDHGPVITPPSGPAREITELEPTVDNNPDANIVEVDVEARVATTTYGDAPPTEVWSYNGKVPGAFLDAKVGDRLIVHFKNSLAEPTTIHWHGIRLPATMDGTLAMQSPIPPGGTFTYEYVLKDAGLYWFHPHIRSDIQIQKGLYGALRVRAANEPASDLERVLVLDDIKLDKDGKVSEYLDDTSRMMGREGNTLLVNGLANAALTAPAGALVRLRLVNVANGRFFKVRIPGHMLRVIGTDGGFVPKPYDTETVLMAPGERYDVMFVAQGEPGSEVAIVNEPYERGHESGKRPPADIAKLRIGPRSATPAPAMPESFPALERLPDGPVDFPVRFNEKPDANGDFIFTINDLTFPNVPPLVIPRGSVRVLEVKNESEMDHPFHLHGFFFQVLARNGVAVAPDALVNKDTQIVPAMGSLKLVARFDEPGKWMYHCHILEHGELGMMGQVHVE